jgi:hypothetical protein
VLWYSVCSLLNAFACDTTTRLTARQPMGDGRPVTFYAALTGQYLYVESGTLAPARLAPSRLQTRRRRSVCPPVF